MREKKLTAYYCDHCNKRLLSKFYMARHEKHCTLNPERSCRLCSAHNADLIKDAMALLPEIPELNKDMSFEQFMCESSSVIKLEDDIKTAMPAMYQTVDCCPACMLSAMRISGATKYQGYDEYREDIKEWWRCKDMDDRRNIDYYC